MEYSDEKTFDQLLQQIGDLYEECKQEIIETSWEERILVRCDKSDIALYKLQELRDIACQLLKRIHHTNNN